MDGDRGGEDRTLARQGFDGEGAAESTGAGPDGGEPVAACACRLPAPLPSLVPRGGGFGSRFSRGVEAVAVVGDVQDDLVVEVRQGERRGRRAGVFADVREGALGDAEQGGPDPFGQGLGGGAVDVAADGEAVGGLALGELVKGLVAAVAVGEVGGSQVVDSSRRRRAWRSIWTKTATAIAGGARNTSTSRRPARRR